VDFNSKTVIVSGAAQGIGAAVAERLAAEGARVALFDLQLDVISHAEALSRRYGRPMLGLPVDVSRVEAVEAAVLQVDRELGPIDVLVNAAGVLRMASVLESAAQDWLDTFAVNTHGVYYLSRQVARLMAARRQGCIVTIGSNAATTPRTRMGAYAASKAATHHLMRCLGLELAPLGIRCNIVSPGSTDTPMQRQLWRTADGADAVIKGDLESYRLGIPLQRIATPEDIADAVCFLASDQARHITMHDLRVDGGATLDS